MFELIVQADFAAAHHLREYPGNCERLHGHNWKLDIVVTGPALDNLGMICDFRVIRKLVAESVSRLDHQYLNQVTPFDKINPTTENIAKSVADQLEERLPEGIRVSRVTAWESEGCGATYIVERKD